MIALILLLVVGFCSVFLHSLFKNSVDFLLETLLESEEEKSLEHDEQGGDEDLETIVNQSWATLFPDSVSEKLHSPRENLHADSDKHGILESVRGVDVVCSEIEAAEFDQEQGLRRRKKKIVKKN